MTVSVNFYRAAPFRGACLVVVLGFIHQRSQCYSLALVFCLSASCGTSVLHCFSLQGRESKMKVTVD